MGAKTWLLPSAVTRAAQPSVGDGSVESICRVHSLSRAEFPPLAILGEYSNKSFQSRSGPPSLAWEDHYQGMTALRRAATTTIMTWSLDLASNVRDRICRIYPWSGQACQTGLLNMLVI